MKLMNLTHITDSARETATWLSPHSIAMLTEGYGGTTMITLWNKDIIAVVQPVSTICALWEQAMTDAKDT